MSAPAFMLVGVEKRYFHTQWWLNHLFIGRRPEPTPSA